MALACTPQADQAATTERVDGASTAPISAGPLTEQDLPAPADLGPSWLPNTAPEDPVHGDPAAGVGDQAWLAERQPAELVAGLVPLGCPELVQMPEYPLPDHALQGRYLTGAGTYAVALRLDYSSTGQAGALLEQLASDTAACTGPGEPVAPMSPYRRSYQVLIAAPGRMHVSWSESGASSTDSTWHLLGASSGTSAGLLFVEERPGAPVDLPDPAALLP